MKSIRIFWRIALLLIAAVSVVLLWGNWRCWLFPGAVPTLSDSEVATYQVPAAIEYISSYTDAAEAADDSATVIDATVTGGAPPAVVATDNLPWQQRLMPTYSTCLANESGGRQALFWSGVAAMLLLAAELLLSLGRRLFTRRAIK